MLVSNALVASVPITVEQKACRVSQIWYST
jgi:hypothetical protein